MIKSCLLLAIWAPLAESFSVVVPSSFITSRSCRREFCYHDSSSSTSSSSLSMEPPKRDLEDFLDFDERDFARGNTNDNKEDDGGRRTRGLKDINPNFDFSDYISLDSEDRSVISEQAKESINAIFDKAEIDLRRKQERFNKDMDRNRKVNRIRLDASSKDVSDKLQSKVDLRIKKVLMDTKAVRESTKLAAKADANMVDKGLELGSWGEVDGRVVLANDGWLGSASPGKKQKSINTAKPRGISLTGAFEEEEKEKEAPLESRIMIVADTKKDELAKELVDPFCKVLENSFPGILVDVVAPISNGVPMGANNAQCVVMFAPSADVQAFKPILERMLTRIVDGATGRLGTPPTQFVCVTNAGTSRLDKMPYSMMNLMGGNKLTKQRDVEEHLIKVVKSRNFQVEPPLDYTICKFAKISSNKKELRIESGDVVDDPIDPEAAAKVLLQAIAFEPTARNATLSAAGSNPIESISKEDWDELFLKLDGPELWRKEVCYDMDADKYAGELGQFMKQWAGLFDSEKIKLTTPVIVDYKPSSRKSKSSEVLSQSGVQLLFETTRTGGNYLNTKEEREYEERYKRQYKAAPLRQKQEGGVEILVEKTISGVLRVRAKRCNLGDNAIIKALSEETILARLEDTIKTWQKKQGLK